MGSEFMGDGVVRNVARENGVRRGFRHRSRRNRRLRMGSELMGDGVVRYVARENGVRPGFRHRSGWQPQPEAALEY